MMAAVVRHLIRPPCYRTPTAAVTRAMASTTDAATTDPVEVYQRHPRSHRQFPVDGVTFEVGTHFIRNEPAPMLMHKNSANDTIPGIHHITPFAKTAFCFFGERGNMGKKTRFTRSKSGVIEDPLEAQHEITLITDAFGGVEGANEELLDYIAWLDEITVKFADHLTEEIDAYPTLKTKFSFLAEKGDFATLREMINTVVVQPVKYAKDADGHVDKTRPMLPIRQKLFYKGSEAKVASEYAAPGSLDEEMLTRGYLRKHVPLYERDGVEVPLSSASIFSGDVVSIESRLLCQLYNIGGNVGASIKRNLYSVVRLEHGGIQYQPQSPFQDVTI